MTKTSSGQTPEVNSKDPLAHLEDNEAYLAGHAQDLMARVRANWIDIDNLRNRIEHQLR